MYTSETGVRVWALASVAREAAICCLRILSVL